MVDTAGCWHLTLIKQAALLQPTKAPTDVSVEAINTVNSELQATQNQHTRSFQTTNLLALTLALPAQPTLLTLSTQSPSPANSTPPLLHTAAAATATAPVHMRKQSHNGQSPNCLTALRPPPLLLHCCRCCRLLRPAVPPTR